MLTPEKVRRQAFPLFRPTCLLKAKLAILQKNQTLPHSIRAQAIDALEMRASLDDRMQNFVEICERALSGNFDSATLG